MLCRSHAATAVCVPGGAGDDARVAAPRSAERPPVAVTWSMVIKSSKGTAAESGNKRRPAPARRSPEMPAIQLPGNSAAASADHLFQVVVMKVAIYCQGCAEKVSKHLSKMEERRALILYQLMRPVLSLNKAHLTLFCTSLLTRSGSRFWRYKVGRTKQMESAVQAKARGSNSVIERKLVHVSTPSIAADSNMGADAVHEVHDQSFSFHVFGRLIWMSIYTRMLHLTFAAARTHKMMLE